MIDEHVQVLTKKIIATIEENTQDFNNTKSFKVRFSGFCYLDRVSGSYEDSLHNLIHKLMWEGIYKQIIPTATEMWSVKETIEKYPDEIYKPDVFSAENEDEEALLEHVEDQLNLIYYKTIIVIKNYLRRFPHFDYDDFSHQMVYKIIQLSHPGKEWQIFQTQDSFVKSKNGLLWNKDYDCIE